MKIGVTKYPGTNNEQDVLRALASLGVQGFLVREHDIHLLEELDAIILAGGFSYGDYLRPGAIASKTPIVNNLPEFIDDAKFVIGICNGFQILCEANLLSGVLQTNLSTKFICKWVNIKAKKTNSPLLKGLEDKILKIPIAHFDGNYFSTQLKHEKLVQNNQIAFQYCAEDGEVSSKYNPNGSMDNIAGIVNKEGNVLGMMPHPERASFSYLGSSDGRIIFQNLIEELK